MDQYIGKMLDSRYEILDVIGVGGMSVVYKAYCHRLHRYVAIKVLKRELAEDADFRRRFHEEAQAVAMLSHPNIVSVYDVSRGFDVDYIVMELIDGITLKQYMKKKEGLLNWRESLFFITQIVRALDHAHGRGIIHRDIKPQNVMVLRDGTVKVADFGIARVVSSSQNTLTQEAMGSVHYISPEQAKGLHVDSRADIYSVGVVLYEMLTGCLPYEGDNAVAVALQHLSSTPKMPRELNPEVPAAMEEITLKAMAPKVEQRYASARDMVRDLEEVRKNPKVEFFYDISEFHGHPDEDEPTRLIETAAVAAAAEEAVHEKRKNGPVAASVRTAVADVEEPVRNSEEPEEPYDDYEEPYYDDYEEPGPNYKKVIIPAVLIIFLVGFGLILWMAFFGGKGNEKAIEVPSLLGMTMDEVYADSEITDHFKIVQSGTQSSSEYPAGQIMSQTPSSGNTVKDGTTISVVISSGEEEITMIGLENINYDQAVARLKELGYKIDEPEYAYSDTIDSGSVISTLPGKGEVIKPGDTVHLVISLGPEPQKVSVPNVCDMTLEKAKEMLTAFGLTIANTVERESEAAAGKVIEQSISPGTEVEEGTGITLSVSTGPATTSSSKSIAVSLPEEPETVKVKVTLDGETQYQEVVSTEVGTVYPILNGTGVQEVCVYIDDELVSQYKLEF